MWVIVIIILIVLLFLFFKFRLRKKTPIILYSGRVGGGKSFSMTADSCGDYKRSFRTWKHYNKPFFSWLYLWIPFFNKRRKKSEMYGLNEPEFYSSYPIKYKKRLFGKWLISKPITLEIMLLQESIPLQSIVVIDEFSSWIDQFEYKESFSPVLNDHIQKWRHYHGNKSHLYIADQCTNNIPIQVRYRCNSAICCLETKHYFKFLHITHYKNIDLTDAIKSVEIIDNDQADTDDKVLRMVRFQIFKHYDDRAYSNRYYFVDGNDKNSKFLDRPLKTLEGIERPNKKGVYPTLDGAIHQYITETRSVHDEPCVNSENSDGTASAEGNVK